MQRRNRLTSSRDVDRVFREGRRGSTPTLLCAVASGGAPDRVRIAVTAASEMRGAVARNRAKRLLREACRALVGRLPAGTDVVVAVRPLSTGKTFQFLETELARALEQAGAPC